MNITIDEVVGAHENLSSPQVRNLGLRHYAELGWRGEFCENKLFNALQWRALTRAGIKQYGHLHRSRQAHERIESLLKQMSRSSAIATLGLRIGETVREYENSPYHKHKHVCIKIERFHFGFFYIFVFI